jgi:hypothetical protein
VPADGVRDIPDVSLFASNGANYSAYVTCDSEGDCTPDASGNFNFDLVGGTSGSTPAMAAIMALVVQKYGRQGQADTVLYPLAQQKSTAFHDVTLGGNWDMCVQGDADCTLNAGSGEGESTAYSAIAGFDLASGWGSVDAANLVNNWNAIAFSSTATSLQVSPSTVMHGQNVTLNASVTPTSGSGTPTGTVAILANSPLPSNGSQTAVALSGGEGSASVNNLPGGTYELTAHYGGDGVFASSTSQPETLTVSPEASTLILKAVSEYATPISSLSYGYPAYLTVQPVGAKLLAGQSDGSASGNVAFTLDGATTSIPLNVSGIASWTTPALSVGSHTASASYSGDASFQASSAAALNFTVYKGYPAQLINVLAPLSPSSNEYVISPSGSVSISAEVGPSVGVLSGSVAPPGVIGPTGTVTICLNTTNLTFPPCTNPPYEQTVALASATGIYGLYSQAMATFSNLAPGQYYAQFAYSGDTNWQTAGENQLNIIAVQASTTSNTASTTTLSISPSSISGTQEAQLNTTVTGSNGVAPTGWVYFYDYGVLLTERYLNPPATGSTSTVSFSGGPTKFWNNGANEIVALYYGDKNYASSTSSIESLTVTQTVGDFAVVPVVPQITVSGGNTGTVNLNLASVNNFNGTLSLSCTPSSTNLSCSVTPASAALNGIGSATLTITTTFTSTSAKLTRAPSQMRAWFGAGIALAFCFVVVLPLRRPRWITMVWLPIVLAASLLVSCGGSGSSSGGGGGGGSGQSKVENTPVGTYSIVITGTANGITHNAVVYVVVH